MLRGGPLDEPSGNVHSAFMMSSCNASKRRLSLDHIDRELVQGVLIEMCSECLGVSLEQMT